MNKSITLYLPLIVLLVSCSQLFAQGKRAKGMEEMDSPFGVAWGFEYGHVSEPVVFMPELRKLGVSSTKIYLFWHGVEPSKGRYDWKSVDAFLAQLRPGDEPLIAVYSSSTWATKIQTTLLPASPARSLEDYYTIRLSIRWLSTVKERSSSGRTIANPPILFSGMVLKLSLLSSLRYFTRL